MGAEDFSEDVLETDEGNCGERSKYSGQKEG